MVQEENMWLNNDRFWQRVWEVNQHMYAIDAILHPLN